MIKDYFLLAYRGLIKRGIRSWLTMIGIFIGIAAVVSLMGLGEGLREAVNSQFGFLGTDYITITASGGLGPPGTGVVNPLTDKELDAIKDVPGIEAVASRLLAAVKFEYNKVTSFTYVGSMPDGDARTLVERAINLKAEKGRLLKDGDKSYVVLGNNYLKDDNIFGKAIIPGAKVKIEGQIFEVAGIIETKGSMQIDNVILMNDKPMRELTNRAENTHDIIVAKFNKNTDVEKIKSEIERELRKVRGVKEGEEDFSVSTPQQILQGVNNVLLGIQIFISIIAAISLLVGGIGIMNTMYTAVVERTREIGIMKAIGAKNSAIFTLFFIESGLLGSIGGLVGALIGAIIAYGLAFIGRLALGSNLISASISLQLFLGAILFSFLLGSFFGTLPAIQASKLNPVDALRRTK